MENIGMAAMMEAPCVVVNIQRGAPSTGLPTLVGQGDMMQCKWGSHGDYEIIAYSPSSPQECFDYVIKAFNSSDRWRVPAFVMADELIGHMTERVVIPPADQIPRVERKRPRHKPGDPDFLHCLAEDEDLVPPIVHAGEGYRVNYDSLTYDEKGYPATFPGPHDKLVRRLVNKIRLNADQIIEYDETALDDAELAVIAYGSTSRSARQSVNAARRDGIRVGLLRLICVWPFPENRVKELAKQVKAFIVPELNLGQISREVERHTSLPVIGVNHAGGVMMAPDPILDTIREVAKNA
jgi:2-oxoglutarate ferredoxin oxidoreductase subunit alpha